MNPFRRLLDVSRSRRAKKVSQEIRHQLYMSPLCSDYENVFAQVRPLIDEMKTVRPFGVGRNGGRLPLARTPELAILNDPNQEMSWVDFADAMFATWLTKDQLYIHAHRSKGGKIIGYTLLPSTSKVWLGNGLSYWQVMNENGVIENLTDDDVMTLRFSRNPDDLTRGISPATAVRIYAQVDDLVAQYQKAYFENGAVPATITFITASTEDNYRKVRHELESGLKGARNRNKTVYAWRQMLPETGQTADQIEVKTIQGTNSTQAIKEIVDVVNDRLNKAYGVSNFILGDDSSAKYDNAELSDHQFTRRRVYPALLSFWNQFQHELDRITGGLGYGIQFELEIPDLTERTKVKAEIAEKNVENLRKLIEAGSKPTSACKALNLNEDWLNVAVGIYDRVLADRELAQGQALVAILQSSANENKHNTTRQVAEHTPSHSADHHCQHHHTDDYFTPFTEEEKVEKKIFERLMSLAKAIFAENPDIDLDMVEREIYELLRDEANNGGREAMEAIQELAEDPDIKDEIATMLKNGVDISDGLSQRIHERTGELVKGFDTHTREIMRATLENTEGLTAGEIQRRLERVLPEGRAATIARNETVYAFKSGRLELDENLAKEFNLQIDLVWHTSPDAGGSPVCSLCEAMEGERIHLGGAFTPKEAIVGHTKDGDPIYGKWEQTTWNDFGKMPNAHANCRCFFDEEIVRTA